MHIPRPLVLTMSSLALAAGSVFAVGAPTQPSAATTTTASHTQPATHQSSSSSCPDRIAGKLPSSGSAVLVAAYLSANKQVVICRADSGQLYYYGQYTDRPDTGLVMEATPTSDGYLARNGAYSYEIRGSAVVVTHNGQQILQEDLQPDPSPS
jgi:hypothetical protein